MLTKYSEINAKRKGIDIRYSTPAVQMLRQFQGRVTGVIAQIKAGAYVQFNANKGLVLCTGGYDNDPEMLKEYFRAEDLMFRSIGQFPELTGDSHKIGLWIGAAMEDALHAMMGNIGNLSNGQTFGLTSLPWLWVDKFGERFVQEHIGGMFGANAIRTLPNHSAWALWDGKWQQDAVTLGAAASSIAQLEPTLATHVTNGVILKADTIEELTQKMKVPNPAVFKATLDRYNQLAKQGQDVDFGKEANLLTTIQQPPYYAADIGTSVSFTLSGLKVNSKLQVLGWDGKVIPGLYAAGNVSGRFFVENYTNFYGGISLGRAHAFGRHAGLSVAALG